MTFNICPCGTQAGYPHAPECPYPQYNPTEVQLEKWEQAKKAKTGQRQDQKTKTAPEQNLGQEAPSR